MRYFCCDLFISTLRPLARFSSEVLRKDSGRRNQQTRGRLIEAASSLLRVTAGSSNILERSNVRNLTFPHLSRDNVKIRGIARRRAPILAGLSIPSSGGTLPERSGRDRISGKVGSAWNMCGRVDRVSIHVYSSAGGITELSVGLVSPLSYGWAIWSAREERPSPPPIAEREKIRSERPILGIPWPP